MKCKKHKTYKAIHRPRVSCFDCWEMYMKLHPKEKIAFKDVFPKLSAAMQDPKKSIDVANMIQKLTDTGVGRVPAWLGIPTTMKTASITATIQTIIHPIIAALTGTNG